MTRRRYIGHVIERGERRSVYEREDQIAGEVRRAIEVYRGWRFVEVPALPDGFVKAEPRPHGQREIAR